MDASILLTANVPSAKKIIVHGPQGPEEGGIPSQFPIGEDVQFCQILREALDFFGIEEDVMREYFLVDHKTRKLARFTEQIFILLFSVHSRWHSGRHHRLKPYDLVVTLSIKSSWTVVVAKRLAWLPN